MKHKHSLIYVKIFFLAMLIGVFYWRDFFLLWDTMIHTGRIILELIVLFLVSVSILQSRSALRTLLLISENRRRGAMFVCFAFIIYVIGSYTSFAILLHFFSLILFIMGYLMLLTDHRIPRILFLPLIVLLFIVPPLETEANEYFPLIFAFSVIGNVLIGVLVVSIIRASTWLRPKSDLFEGFPTENNESKDESCLLCQSKILSEETFCFHCGKRRRTQPMPRSTKSVKSDLLKILVLLLSVFVLSLVVLPTFSFSNKEPFLVSFSVYGLEKEAIIPRLSGWKLESYERLTDYEKEHVEDFAAKAAYTTREPTGNKSHIMIEIGSHSLYMMDRWNLPGWQITQQHDVPLVQALKGKFVVLTSEGNGCIVVFYWTTRLIFGNGLAFSLKNVGVSVFSILPESLTESDAFEISSAFSRFSLTILDSWYTINRWTLHFQTISEISTNFKDGFFTIIGGMAVLMLAGWIRSKDERTDRLAESAFIYMDAEPRLFLALSIIEARSFLGKELFEIYEKVTGSKADFQEFYEKLRKLAGFGLIGKDYVWKNGELVLIWKKMFV